MDRIVRTIMALIVLVSQMSRIGAACGCPEIASRPTLTSKVSTVCPMSGQVGCQCCAGETKEPSERPPLGARSAHCEVVLTGPSCALLSHAVSISPLFAQVLPPCVNGFDWVHRLPKLSHPGLLLQRIRPPNGWINGLRAPPAC